MVGIVASGLNACDAEDPLTDQVRERGPSLPRCGFVGQTQGERLDQAVHTLSRLEQVSAAVGTRALLTERGVEWLVEQIREQNSLRYHVRRQAGVSVMLNVCRHDVYPTPRRLCLSQNQTPHAQSGLESEPNGNALG